MPRHLIDRFHSMSFQNSKRYFLQSIAVFFQTVNFWPKQTIATTAQKWTQKRCFPSFSDFLTIISGFLTLNNIPGSMYSQKG